MAEIKNLVEEFHQYVTRSIQKKGVFPFPGMSIDEEGKLEIAACCEPESAFMWFWKKITLEGSKECIFGLDRITKDGQGTEFGDVLTCVHWSEGMDGKKWDTSFRIGVINYQFQPRIVRPFDFENQFWIEKMTAEVKSFRPSIRVVLKKGAAT